MLNTSDPTVWDAPATTPGTRHCGGLHYALPEHQADGSILWRCKHCQKTRAIADGPEWR